MVDQNLFRTFNLPIVRGIAPPPLAIRVPTRMRVTTVGGDVIEVIVAANSQIHSVYGHHSVLTGIELSITPELMPAGPRVVQESAALAETPPESPNRPAA